MTAKSFLRHAHYVAASRVTSLQGLQILKWNEDLISVNEDVEKHLDFLHNHKSVQLCYTPVYNLQGSLKVVYLNTRSLHKHILDVKSSHNMLASDIVIIAETQLKTSDDNSNYQLRDHSHILRNDQQYSGKTRPAHGLIGYVHDGMRVLEEHKYTSEKFEAIHMCVHKQNLSEPLQVVGIYVSPQISFQELKTHLQIFMYNIDTTSSPTVIIGNFNMKSVTKREEYYNQPIEDHIQRNYNMRQYIDEPTHDNNSILDLCFSTRNVETSVIWNYWSDHAIIAASIQNE